MSTFSCMLLSRFTPSRTLIAADKSELFLDVCAVYKDLMHDYQSDASGLCTLLKQKHHLSHGNAVLAGGLCNFMAFMLLT